MMNSMENMHTDIRVYRVNQTRNWDVVKIPLYGCRCVH